MPGIAERCKGRDRRTVRTANPLSGFGLMGLGEGEQVRLLASSVTSRSIGLRRSETTNRERGLHTPFFDPESHFVIRHCYSNLHLRGREKSPPPTTSAPRFTVGLEVYLGGRSAPFLCIQFRRCRFDPDHHTQPVHQHVIWLRKVPTGQQPKTLRGSYFNLLRTNIEDNDAIPRP
jgi:hypothetical protein